MDVMRAVVETKKEKEEAPWVHPAPEVPGFFI